MENSWPAPPGCLPSGGGGARRAQPRPRSGGGHGAGGLDGRDKLTIVADPALSSVGSWLEQLIAESTGKLGQGIVPVDLEPLAAPSAYGKDRLFVYLRRDGQHDAALAELQKSGQPVLTFDLLDPYDLAPSSIAGNLPLR